MISLRCKIRRYAAEWGIIMKKIIGIFTAITLLVVSFSNFGASAAEAATQIRLISLKGGKALSVLDRSTENGKNAIAWTDKAAANQTFDLIYTNDGYCKMVAKHSGKGLGIYAASKAEGGEVVQWSLDGTPNQEWKLEPVPYGGGTCYKVINRGSGLCLAFKNEDASDGTIAVQSTYTGSEGQLWQAVRVSGEPLRQVQKITISDKAQEGRKVSCSVNCRLAGKYIVCCASYKDGELCGITKKEFELSEGESAAFEAEIAQECEKGVIYAWEKEGLKPAMDKTEIGIPEGALPEWTKDLRESLEKTAEALSKKLTGGEFPPLTVTAEDFGFKEGLATAYIQAAVNYVSENGGGTVCLKDGDYTSGTIVMRSNVRLEVQKGARLLGSTDLNDYPEHIAQRQTVMDTNMGMNQSLIFAEGCDNISICGEGVVDGQGTQDNFPGKETTGGTPGRPFLIRILDCTNVHVKDINLKDAACWMQNYLNCENVLIENINVENQANYNNDGIDIDGCRNVIVRGCYVSSGDDAMCFKGASQTACENVLVENCTFLSSCNGLKFGTDSQGDFRNVLVRNCTIGGVSEDMRRIKHAYADSGISFEGVDGGTVENILVTDVEIIRAMSPLFLRVDDRARVKPTDERPPVSSMRRIVFENITGSDNGARGSYFLGIAEKSIEDIVLLNISLGQKPTSKNLVKEESIGEMRGVYPDAHMIDGKGDAPAYALWARHVKNLTLINYCVKPEGHEIRPRLVLCSDVSFAEYN